MDKMDVVFDGKKISAHSELEASFRDGAGKFREAVDQMGLSLYNIQKFGTWQVARNHEGELFPAWEAYIKWLGDDVGLARSSMFDYKSMVRFAITNGLVDSSDQFIDRGGVLTFRRIKKRTICNSVGEIVGLKDAESDNPVGLIKEVVEIIDPDARPMDQVKLIKEVISNQTDKVDIWIDLKPNKHAGHDLAWTKESNAGREEGLVQFGCPPEVLDELKSKLHLIL